MPTIHTSNRLDPEATSVLFTAARTARTFSDAPVTDDELSQIWTLAKWAPTSANTQPLRIVYVRTPEGRDRLVPQMNEGNRERTASAPAAAILAVDRSFHLHIPEVLPFRPELREVFDADNEMRERTGESNAWLQAGYFILAVRASGLAAGPMSGFDAAAMDAEFFPDGRHHALLVVNIGHPGDNPWSERLPRLSDSQTLTWA